MKVLLVLAHPRSEDSFCGALAKAYQQGAREAGCDVQTLSLSALSFDPDVVFPSPKQQPLEQDLSEAQRAIENAEHLVFVYPTWWGSYPALLKGFLDRVLVPDWAFEETAGGTGFNGLLGGRTAELLTTMDTPTAVYSLVYRSPGRNAMARATLGFCGVDTVRHTRFGPVNKSKPDERERWISRARALGQSLSRGVYSPRRLAIRKVAPWLTAMRLQFYPMTFFAYWMGALLGAAGTVFDTFRFLLGYLVLVALEAGTVFGNELEDERSDRRNKLWGPFNGGSRVLVRGLVDRPSLKLGITIALTLCVIFAVPLVHGSQNPVRLGAFLAVFAVLCLGYTLPPLKLSYRSLGEVDVALTHSVLAILFGLLVQDGSLTGTGAWLIAIPLFFSILPAITLSGIPDHDADATAGKRTLAVAFGITAAIRISALSTVVAALGMVLVEVVLLPGVYGFIVAVLMAMHALFLLARLRRESEKAPTARRIDATMIWALSFILWFCVPPLWTIGNL